MSENANAFWASVKVAAANLNLEIKVHEDGRMGLHHLKDKGRPDRPTEKAVETFRNFVGRPDNRAMILKANGIEQQADGIALDARRWKQWLEYRRHGWDHVFGTVYGETIDFATVRDSLLRSYSETVGWVLAVYRLDKALNQHMASIREKNLQVIPEAWAADWGIEIPVRQPEADEDTSSASPPPIQNKPERVKERTLFDG